MNKHGQTLILFIILIPLIILLLAVVVDVGVVVSQKARLREVTQMVIEEVMEDDDKQQKAYSLFLKNDIETLHMELLELDNGLEIKNEIEVDSVFGTIIGIKKYTIKIDLKGFKKNEKIVFE